MVSALHLILQRLDRVLGVDAVVREQIHQTFKSKLQSEFGPNFVGSSVRTTNENEIVGELHVGFVLIEFSISPGLYSCFKARIMDIASVLPISGVFFDEFVDALKGHAVYGVAIDASKWVQYNLNKVLSGYGCDILVQGLVNFQNVGNFHRWECGLRTGTISLGRLSRLTTIEDTPVYYFFGGVNGFLAQSPDLDIVIQAVLKTIIFKAVNQGFNSEYVLYLDDFARVSQNQWQCSLAARTWRGSEVKVGAYSLDGSGYTIIFVDGEKVCSPMHRTVIEAIHGHLVHLWRKPRVSHQVVRT